MDQTAKLLISHVSIRSSAILNMQQQTPKDGYLAVRSVCTGVKALTRKTLVAFMEAQEPQRNGFFMLRKVTEEGRKTYEVSYMLHSNCKMTAMILSKSLTGVGVIYNVIEHKFEHECF